ncbi:MAG: ABC transporter permease subunit, partial [Planctomycetia bacterium]|nr:ABC transporter permease subunit [Planctomycetia bacterium]
LFGTLFVVVTAALSIGEEIEGRTAVTVLSKPLSRRQFLLGKFAGLLLSGLLLSLLLGWWLSWCLYLKPIIDPNEVASDPLQAQLLPSLQGLAGALTFTDTVGYFLQGTARWFADSLSVLPGLLVGFGQVMLFLGVASALATRLPLVVNLGVCLALFFLGNLAPILLQSAQRLERQFQREHPGSTSATLELVQFTARMLDTVLPALEYFGIGPAIIRDRPLPLGPYLAHVGLTTGYSIMYTAIALLVGLILFEDRDVA